VRGREAVLSGLEETPAPEDMSVLAGAVEQLEKAAARGRELRREIASLDESMSIVDGQINEWLWANPSCPTCGGKTTREALLAGGHVHVVQTETGGAV
jgi:hypothetical protein